MWGGINDGEVCPMHSGGFQNVRQDGGLCRDDDGAFLSSAVVPSFCAGLRVEVDDDNLLPCGLLQLPQG